mmetsp:Transcript_12752/g.39977  ORF Transcript_12752/g.39977 Transcript_12752/m.39977 type:complete len:248 (+) Transcript_12752:312-1055(+)
MPVVQYAAWRARMKPGGARRGSAQSGRESATMRVPALTLCNPWARRITALSSKAVVLTRTMLAWCHSPCTPKMSPQCMKTWPCTSGASRPRAASASWCREGQASMPEAAPRGTMSAHATSMRPTPLPRCNKRSPGSGARQDSNEAMAGNDSSAGARLGIAPRGTDEDADGASELKAAQKALYSGMETFCTSLPEHCRQRPPDPWLHRTTSAIEKFVAANPPAPSAAALAIEWPSSNAGLENPEVVIS